MKTKQIQWEQGVVSAIEHLIECTTSDAQAIMEAHEAKFPEELEVWFQNNMDPEGAARNVIGTSKENAPTPLMEEFLIMVDAASAMLNTAEDPDPEHPEPVIDGIELANEASDMVEQIREHYTDLLNAAIAYRNHLKTAAHTEGEVRMYEHLCDVIAKAK